MNGQWRTLTNLRVKEDSGAQIGCPIDDPNYASIGGTCYFFDTVQRTKFEAKENCIQNDGKLWEPNSIEIINQVYSKAQEVSEDKYWVGISDAASEGTFKFDSNEEIFPFTPQNAPWNGNEPNGGATENCVCMGDGNNLEFFDVKCTDGRKYRSICETSGDKCFLYHRLCLQLLH